MGLVIVIEPHGTYAIYEQIVNQIKNQIISGELQPDEALPSIRGLAADIGVSVITTKHAYEELEREGLIRSVSNKGFYVCKYNTDYLHEKQLMELEKRLQEWITLAKQAGLGTEDIREMLEYIRDFSSKHIMFFQIYSLREFSSPILSISIELLTIKFI